MFIFGIGYDRSYSTYGFYTSSLDETCDECNEAPYSLRGLRVGRFYIWAGRQF